MEDDRMMIPTVVNTGYMYVFEFIRRMDVSDCIFDICIVLSEWYW